MQIRVLGALGAAVVAVCLGGTATAAGQPPAAGPRGGQRPPAIEPGESLPANPAEVGRLFDAYAIVQAQEQLGLGEDEFGRFLPRFKVVVDVRRRHMQERLRLLGQLGRLARAPVPDETALRQQLRQLDDHEAMASAEVRKATDALVALLTPLQQARFRLFEEQMERRKLDLMTRARQGNRRNPRMP